MSIGQGWSKEYEIDDESILIENLMSKKLEEVFSMIWSNKNGYFLAGPRYK